MTAQHFDSTYRDRGLEFTIYRFPAAASIEQLQTGFTLWGVQRTNCSVCLIANLIRSIATRAWYAISNRWPKGLESTPSSMVWKNLTHDFRTHGSHLAQLPTGGSHLAILRSDRRLPGVAPGGTALEENSRFTLTLTLPGGILIVGWTLRFIPCVWVPSWLTLSTRCALGS